MEQFTLGKYLKNPNRKIITQDGRSVRVICVNRINGSYPVVALIRNDKDCESLMSYTIDGKLYDDQDDGCDLFFAPGKKGERWINIFHNSDSVHLVGENAYETKEEARGAVHFLPNVATVKIEWEE